MLAVHTMSFTAAGLFYIVAVVLFVLAGIGLKTPGDRVHLVGLGLAAAFFPTMWNVLASPFFLN
jgi:hypothetical protein